jgi:hypothetical protein
MKILIFFLFIFSSPCFGQYPKKANVAIIESDSLFDSHLFQLCINVLESEGYQLNSINYPSLMLSTNPVEIHELPLHFKLEIKVEGVLASIRGYIRDQRDFVSMGLQPIPQKWEDASFRSFRGSIWRTGFDVIVRVTERIRSEINGKVYWDHW